MINNLIKFPIWKDDSKEVVNLNNLQKRQIDNFRKKVNSKEYQFIDNPCLCGNKDNGFDILIAQKDRYGISCDNILCKKCSLIRLKERLDDYSTAEFYKNEYRDIYVGKEEATDEFFNAQAKRGNIFLDLISTKVDIENIKSVFEVGCGAGGILFPFYEIGKKVSGCDFGEKYLNDFNVNFYQAKDINGDLKIRGFKYVK